MIGFMDANMKTQSLDSILESLDPSASFNKDEEQVKAVTFWIGLTYKDKWDRVQRKTKFAFGKKMQEILKTALDRVDTEELEA
jgi:hypothetical protein